MKKLYVFTESEKDMRLKRISEEIKKNDYEIELIHLNAYKTVTASDGLYYDGKKIQITSEDYCWLLSNSTMNYFLIKKLSYFKPKALWPDTTSLNLSDKFLAADFFHRINIPTPKTVLLSYNNIDNIQEYFSGYPLIIKKNTGTVGRDVDIVNNEEEIRQFIFKVFERIQNKVVSVSRVSFILQEFIKESSGSDYRVLCLDGKILGAIKRTAQGDNFKANISLGGTAEKIEISHEVKEMALKILKEGKLFYAGIDFIKSDRGFLALEVNTSAQFKGFEAATGINVAKQIVDKFVVQKS